MTIMSRPYSPDEPARQPDYRRFYQQIKRHLDALHDGVSALYRMHTQLRDRVHRMEGRMGSSHLDPYTFKLVDRKPVQCPNDEEWFRWYMEITNRLVAHDVVGDIVISTVFTSLNFLPPPDHDKLFETEIFGGNLNGRIWRALTWEEAEANHEIAVAVAKVENE